MGSCLGLILMLLWTGVNINNTSNIVTSILNLLGRIRKYLDTDITITDINKAELHISILLIDCLIQSVLCKIYRRPSGGARFCFCLFFVFAFFAKIRGSLAPRAPPLDPQLRPAGSVG